MATPHEPRDPAAPGSSADPTAELPATPPAGPPAGAAQAGPPPTAPPPGPPAGPPPAGPPPGGPGPVGPGGPPPRRPGLWRQATSTTGGTIAVIIAAALSALLLVGLASAAALAIGRGVWHHQRQERVEQARDRLDDGFMAPGQRKRLDQGQGPMMRQNGPDPGPGNGLGPLMRGANGLGGVQHGEFTVTGSDGKATTMTVQRGEVTKVSDTSLTVKSEDGFTATYAVSVDTRRTGARDLANGDTVLVVAEKSGAKAVLVQARR